MTLADVDAVAATAGPGLIGGVMVGLVTGKALAHAAQKPLIAINHLEGHALSPRLADPTLRPDSTATMRSPSTAMSTPSTGSAPVPSTSKALRMTRSCIGNSRVL